MSRNARWASLVAGAVLVAACTGQSAQQPAAKSVPSDGASRTNASAALIRDVIGFVVPRGAGTALDVANRLDATDGAGATAMLGALDRAQQRPLAASGEPVLLGLQNLVPGGSVESDGFEAGVRAAVGFINDVLGGVGADPVGGEAGRPLRLVHCPMELNPVASTRCAAELAERRPVAVLQGVNFFADRAAAVLQPVGIPVVQGSPMTAADLSTPGLFSLGPNCFATAAGAARYAAVDLAAANIALLYPASQASAPAPLCFRGFAGGALDVLSGVTTSGASDAGRAAGMTSVQIPVGEGVAADFDDVARSVTRANAAAVVVGLEGESCWAVLDALASRGSVPAPAGNTPSFVFSGGCADPAQLARRPAVAQSATFVTDGRGRLEKPRTELQRREVELATSKLPPEATAWGAPQQGAALTGFATTMTLWQVIDEAVDGAGSPARGNGPPPIVGPAVAAALAGTDGHHAFAGLPFGCVGAPEGYRSLCARLSLAARWDGAQLVAVSEPIDATQANAGTSLDLGR